MLSINMHYLVIQHIMIKSVSFSSLPQGSTLNPILICQKLSNLVFSQNRSKIIKAKRPGTLNTCDCVKMRGLHGDETVSS